MINIPNLVNINKYDVIVIKDQIKFYFVILGDARIHKSKDLEDCNNCYAFSSEEICAHSISDHNFYSVCKVCLIFDRFDSYSIGRI